MAFWAGETIIERYKRDNIISPFDPAMVDCGAYTLSIGQEIFITPHTRIDNRYAEQKCILREGQSFAIPPGQFAFLLTKESISIPIDTIGFISLKSSIKYLGLVNVSGFHVDPGFRGNLIYAVYNAGPQPIQLVEGQPLFLIWFAELDRPSTEFPSLTTYNRLDKPVQTSIPSDLLQKIPGHIYTLQSLADEYEKLREDLSEKVRGLERSYYNMKVWGSVVAFLIVTAISAARFVFGASVHFTGG